ncbi:hypothetical protein [Arthrobacter cupressi]|uniref:Uncharacterized protein n=1 Tax=Arthrobacter cupressi TaxID=1045773 RepID=A0A1G8PYF7_9MICC|nr:hypothetical protein [Arthrobacter cupressi]NYD77969.1 hypothetical protein [Arthrobacter cupressi]SDI97534.1 hypothetical protein SAMN05216555_1065 [Arthrobacter cupressi]
MNTKPWKKTLGVLSAPLLLLAASGAADAQEATPPVASTIIKCELASSGGTAPLYDGKSASYMYDARFKPGPELTDKELSDHTPQGVAWWKNWDGKGNNLLLVTTYGKGGAHIVGLDPTDRTKTVGTVLIKPRNGTEEQTHAGGIAVNDKWAFIDGPKSGGWHTIRKYSLSGLRASMTAGNGSVSPAGADRKVYGASFLTIDGGHLYAGKFSKEHRDWMYSYTIGGDGSLTLDRKSDGNGLRWEVPQWTQGVAVADGRFLFSTSSGRAKRSNLYVTNKAETNLDKAAVRCFRAPSMAEGITATPAGEAYLLFESGSYKYDGTSSERAINVIDGVHRAKLSTLTSLPGGKIHFGTLHCVEQEDFLGDDEIQIKVEDQQLGKSVQIGSGDKKRIDKTVQFTGKVSVKLYENDVEGDDYLGQHVFDPVNKDGIMEFSKDGAKYRLSYSIR